MWPRLSTIAANAGYLAVAVSLMGSAQGAGKFASSTLAPEPTDKSTIEAQLKRFIGQTQFLNPVYRYRGFPGGAPAKGAQEKGGAQDSRRAQQESDVFKIGKPGSKLLYLLNNYRGLQVVSFADGVDKPKLVGRVAATGNYPNDMYYDEAGERLLVLERYWFDGGDSYVYSREQSRVLVYDVKNPAAPKISSQLAFEGEIADSRMVGDVLYVATSVRPDWRNHEDKGKGYVYSVKLGAADPQIIEKQELALPSSSRENMNIVEIEKDGSYKYYLVAVLSETGWGWWDRKSLVEVVDISDAHGKIKSLMVASAKGNVGERSQTFIKNDTLLVTSNYTPEAADNSRPPMRIAVETFKLPSAEQSEVLSEDEAQYRKLHIDRQLKSVKSEAERTKLYEKLVSDPELGIKGRFVRTAEGTLRKIISDSVVTVGDTTGLSASLQDVRYEGDHLYVFWVPANQKDPFDLFDISHPENGVKYLKRLQFDGWIERAIPLAYQGKKYVLGLGFTVPAVDNERSRRYPQAMLFEIETRGTQTRAIDVAQLTLSMGNVWTDFNSSDKFIEMHMTGDGKGQLMFKVDSYNEGKFVSGGKLVGFDLAKAVSGEGEVFQEGALLMGDTGWLKRVFTNPEIERVNSFSDLSLGTYDVKDIGTSSSIVAAMHALELARDIQAYAVIGSGASARGVQIISKGNYWDESSTPETLLRVTALERPDAELPATLSSQTLKGAYLASLVDSRDQSLWIATRQTKNVQKPDGTTEYFVRYTVSHLSIDGTATLSVHKPLSWKVTENYGRYRWYWYGAPAFQFVQLTSGRVLARANTELYELSEAGELSLQPISFENCVFGKEDNLELKFVANDPSQLFLSHQEMIESRDYNDVAFTRNFATPVTLEGAKAVCGKSVNIPGTLLAVVGSGQWVTQDDRALDLVPRGEKSHELFTSTALDSLTVATDVATLMDDYELNTSQPNAIKMIAPGKLGFFDAEERTTYYRGGYDAMPVRCKGIGCVPYYRPQSYDRFVVLGFGKDLRFTKEVFVLPEIAGFNGQLVELFPESGGSTLGVLSNGRTLRVIRFSSANLRPSFVRLTAVDPLLKKAEPADSVVLPGWYYSINGDSSGMHYTAPLKSLEVARGLFGVQQFYLE